MCCFRRSVPLRVRPARLVEPPVGQVRDVVRLALRPSGDHQSPSGPSYLETGVLPGAVWGFLLLPRFVNQVLDCRAVRPLPASPGPELPRARGLRRPVLAQPWEPHSGSGRPAFAGLSESWVRCWLPQAGIGGHGPPSALSGDGP